jgi:hypothetical protein
MDHGKWHLITITITTIITTRNKSFQFKLVELAAKMKLDMA